MAIKRRASKCVRTRPTYTPIGRSSSRVVYIEAVFDTWGREEVDSLDRGLDALRELGGAEVVDIVLVEEDFDEACRILGERRHKP